MSYTQIRTRINKKLKGLWVTTKTVSNSLIKQTIRIGNIVKNFTKKIKSKVIFGVTIYAAAVAIRFGNGRLDRPGNSDLNIPRPTQVETIHNRQSLGYSQNDIQKLISPIPGTGCIADDSRFSSSKLVAPDRNQIPRTRKSSYQLATLKGGVDETINQHIEKQILGPDDSVISYDRTENSSLEPIDIFSQKSLDKHHLSIQTKGNTTLSTYQHLQERLKVLENSGFFRIVQEYARSITTHIKTPNWDFFKYEQVIKEVDGYVIPINKQLGNRARNIQTNFIKIQEQFPGQFTDAYKQNSPFQVKEWKPKRQVGLDIAKKDIPQLFNQNATNDSVAVINKISEHPSSFMDDAVTALEIQGALNKTQDVIQRQAQYAAQTKNHFKNARKIHGTEFWE